MTPLGHPVIDVIWCELCACYHADPVCERAALPPVIHGRDV